MLELINSTGSYFLGYPVLIEHLLDQACPLATLEIVSPKYCQGINTSFSPQPSTLLQIAGYILSCYLDQTQLVKFYSYLALSHYTF